MTASTLAAPPTPLDVPLLLERAAILLRRRGWQGWGLEDHGVLSIDGALIVAAGGTVSGHDYQLPPGVADMVANASAAVVTTNGIPVGPDSLWEWEYDGHAVDEPAAVRAVETTYAVWICGTRARVGLVSPYTGGDTPFLYGTAARYRSPRHEVAVDCPGAAGRIWVAPRMLRLAREPRW
jgi:hypothetical protein